MDKFKEMVSARRAGLVATLSILTALGTVGVANATTTNTDPLQGAGDSFFTTLQNYLTGHLIVAVIALAVIGVAVGMLIKWGKKGAKSA